MEWLNKLLLSIFVGAVSFIFPSAHKGSSPVLSPTPTPSVVTPSITPMVSPSDVTSFIYPNAQKTSETNNSITLQSSDSPQQIMQWYQKKINSLNMHSVSNVQTNTNGNEVDVLDSSDGNKEVKVELHKNVTDAFATFTVTVSGVSPQSSASGTM